MNSIARIAFRLQLAVSILAWSTICVLLEAGQGVAYELLFFCLLVWQCCMLGFWTGLGRGKWRFPVVIVLSAVVVLMCGFAAGGELPEFTAFCVGVISVVALTTGLLRLTTGPLVKASASAEVVDVFQFHIGHVLGLTTVVAIAFGLFRAFGNFFDASYGVEGLPEIFGLGACLAVATFANIWTFLSPRVSAFSGWPCWCSWSRSASSGPISWMASVVSR